MDANSAIGQVPFCRKYSGASNVRRAAVFVTDNSHISAWGGNGLEGCYHLASESSGDRENLPIILGDRRSEVVGTKVIAGFLVTLAMSCLAQEHQHRNAEKLGTVQFATSCNEVAQKDVNRAVALLHSFQFSRAIEGFNSALAEDKTCGIAYWGITLSDWSNPFAAGMKDKNQLQAGREASEHGRTVGAKTERERAYLSAVGKLY